MARELGNFCDHNHGRGHISRTFWAVLGVSSLFSGPILGIVSDCIGRSKTLGILFGFQALSHALLAFSIPSAYLLISASLLTLFFGIGQIIGLLITGIMIDLKGKNTNLLTSYVLFLKFFTLYCL